MSKYTVTLTATSVKSFEIDAHTADEAIAIMYDIRQHTDMLNFNETDVTEMTATAEPTAAEVPIDDYGDEDDTEDRDRHTEDRARKIEIFNIIVHIICSEDDAD